MSKVYVLRHAEKDDKGLVSEAGLVEARNLAARLPEFDEVVVSPSERTEVTARAISTTVEPIIDERAGFAMASPELSEAINALAADEGISFLMAAIKYNDPEVMQGITDQAERFNELLDELLVKDIENILVVSHDLTIIPAMQTRGSSVTNIPYLGGFVLSDSGLELL
jgi:broad specificity phosphatase PhoE